MATLRGRCSPENGGVQARSSEEVRSGARTAEKVHGSGFVDAGALARTLSHFASFSEGIDNGRLVSFSCFTRISFFCCTPTSVLCRETRAAFCAAPLAACRPSGHNSGNRGRSQPPVPLFLGTIRKCRRMQGESKPNGLCFPAKDVENHPDLEDDLKTLPSCGRGATTARPSVAYGKVASKSSQESRAQ
jgi:hypothetical protein